MLSALPDSPSPTGLNESAMSQPMSMWSDEIEYVELDKEDRGLGFSILDYKVSKFANRYSRIAIEVQESSFGRLENFSRISIRGFKETVLFLLVVQ